MMMKQRFKLDKILRVEVSREEDEIWDKDLTISNVELIQSSNKK
jgi:hypothetical protein